MLRRYIQWYISGTALTRIPIAMKFRFELSPSIDLAEGPQPAGNVFSLLGAIRETGSLQQAALRVGLSYRYAWGSIRHWESLFDRSIVTMQRGKGAELTRFGESLLVAENRVREVVEPVIESAAAEFHRYLGDSLTSRTQVRFSGRPDAAIDVMKDSLAIGEADMSLDTVFCGAVDGLICLHERQAELAGFHVSPVHQPGTRLHAAFKPWLKPSDVRLVRVAWRDQGLMMAPRLARSVKSVADLASPEIRFINRERGSSTRALFDQVVTSGGVHAERIAGYERYAFGNRLVGEAVRQGDADVGFGLRSTAETLGLHYVPLTREAYYLALRNSDRDAAWVTALLDMLRSEQVAGQISAIPGYQPEPSLRLMPVHEALPW